MAVEDLEDSKLERRSTSICLSSEKPIRVGGERRSNCVDVGISLPESWSVSTVGFGSLRVCGTGAVLGGYFALNYIDDLIWRYSMMRISDTARRA